MKGVKYLFDSGSLYFTKFKREVSNIVLVLILGPAKNDEVRIINPSKSGPQFGVQTYGRAAPKKYVQ